MSSCRDAFPNLPGAASSLTRPESDVTNDGPSMTPIATLGAQTRADFPVLNQEPAPGRKPLVFLDTAASSQKPSAVIDAVANYYRTTNANIHRGVYDLSERATMQYEAARATLADFIGAENPRECIFVRNTTEGINLVAHTWGRRHIREGDLIVLTVMEHHSNIVPWQLLAEATGAELAYVRMLPNGTLDLDHLDELLARGPKLVAFSFVSNALGTIHPAQEITRRAKAAGATVLVDGAQAVPHLKVNVQEIDCDFLALSGHKMLGPMGSGVLWGRYELLDSLPPFMGGGSMIRKVELTHSTWADVPARFEAGTPAVGEAIGLGVAAEYLDRLGMENVRQHERELTEYALNRLAELPEVTVLGPRDPDLQAGVISFTVEGVHPHDVAAILNEEGVAVRAGHHCCQPLMRELDVVATTRASFGVYSIPEDVDRLITGLTKVNEIFAI